MPLYITRCSTVYSLNQLVDDGAKSAELPLAKPEEPVSACAGTRFPLYNYVQRTGVGSRSQVLRVLSKDDFARVPDVDDASDQSCQLLLDAAGGALSDDETSSQGSVLELGTVPQKSLMDSVLLALWEDCAEQGLFRYDVTACPTKVVPGIYGFVAQLNEGRATKKRPTEFRVDQVVQEFDEGKFNFKKAYMKEVLFQFEPSRTGAPHFEERGRASSSPNLVLINVSPIEYGHVLLVPRVLDNLPQLVDEETVHQALHFTLETDNPYMRVGYNSLGAYATINHLHFQAYYLAAPFPCERAPTIPLGRGLKRRLPGVRITRMVDYPVNGFVVEGEDLGQMAQVVGQACIKMQKNNIPHNLLIADRGSRVFIWPQCYAEKQAQGRVPEDILETGVNPACFEIAGHMVLKRKEDYEQLTQDKCWRLLAEVSLPEERFMDVASLCFGDLLNLSGDNMELPLLPKVLTAATREPVLVEL